MSRTICLTKPRLITWNTLPPPVRFWVRNSAGDEILVDARNFHTIRSIKVKLLVMTGIPPEHQVLFLGKEVLDDDSLFARYNIFEGSVLRLICLFRH